MTTAELRPQWNEPDPYRGDFMPGSWGIVLTGTGPANQLGHHMIGIEHDLDAIGDLLERIEDLMAGRRRPGAAGGDNDGGFYYGNGYFYVASDYEERDQLVVTATTFRAAFEWLRDLRAHPDFTNPDAGAGFKPLVVEIVAHGPGSLDTYLELGGSVFVESSPSTDHLN